jgi:recombination protein RecA
MDLNEYLKLTEKVVGKKQVCIGNQVEVQRFKLESPSINYLLGGGVPFGTIIEIYGPEQTSKSLLAMYIAAQLQQQTDKFVGYIQASEFGYTSTHAANVGLDPDKVLLVDATSAEEGLQCTRSYLSDDFCAVIIDSVAGLVPEKLTDESKEVGDVHVMGVRARLLSENLPQFSVKCKKHNVVLILINQVRNTNLSGYGNPEGSMGGKGLPYWASIRLMTSKRALKAPDEQGINDFDVQIKCIKSKYGRALRSIDMQVDLEQDSDDKTITNTMYNPYIDLIRMAKHPDVNVIKQAGSWITLSLPNLSSEEPIKIQGEGNLATKLKAEESLFIALRDHVNSLI